MELFYSENYDRIDCGFNLRSSCSVLFGSRVEKSMLTNANADAKR